MNTALVALLEDPNDAQFRKKMDNERLRRLFLLYTSRMAKAMSSPKYNYFTGLASSAPRLLHELREHTLSTFKLSGRCGAREGAGAGDSILKP